MATGYKALLALGDSHTKSVESTVQAALAQKKLKDQQRRKQQEEQEQKQRELETKLRLRYFEEQKKKEAVEAKRAEERKAKETELLRREAEQRDALRYGPKKAKAAAASSTGKWPTSGSGVREDVRRKRVPDDEEEGDTGNILTREEKRERKLQAELKKAFHAPRRSGGSTSGYRKPGRRLPGGAYDVATTPEDAITATSGPGNVKDRLAAMPNTLTRLNVVKRDTRTIDEIVRDRRENKEVLNGDQARGFDDWFTSSRVGPKKDKAPVASSSASSSSSRPSSQPTTAPVAAAKRPPAPPTPKSRPKASAAPPASSSSSTKKRPRSPSMSRSASPPPPKRAHVGSTKSAGSSASHSRSPRAAGSSLSEEIWGLFGKSKAAYVARDVLSDSEDDDVAMEAGASALEREEKLSERIARREEREAELAERRHEEEKRRRKAAASAAR